MHRQGIFRTHIFAAVGIIASHRVLILLVLRLLLALVALLVRVIFLVRVGCVCSCATPASVRDANTKARTLARRSEAALARSTDRANAWSRICCSRSRLEGGKRDRVSMRSRL